MVRSQNTKKSASGAPTEVIKKPKATTLADQHYEKGLKKARNDQAAKLTALKATVRKCIRDNFNDFSEQELYHTKVNNQSLWDRLMQDKGWAEAKDPRAPSFGKLYFVELRDSYQRKDDGEDDALDIKDENAPINRVMFAAVDASRTGGGRDKLIQFCHVSKLPPNQTEVVGLFLHVLELKPHLGGSHQEALVAILRYVQRFTLDEMYPGEFRAVRHKLDECMVQAFTNHKNKGYKLDRFLKTWAKECALLIPVEAAVRLSLVKGSWVGHSEDINLVYSSSLLGKKMFGFAYEASYSHIIGDEMQKLIDKKLQDLAHVTADSLIELREELQAMLESRNAHTDLPSTRIVEIPYNGQSIKRKVESLYGEQNLRINTSLRLLALRSTSEQDKRHLEPFFCEDDLLSTPRVLQRKVIDEDVLSAFISVRATAVDQLPVQRQGNGEFIKDPCGNNMLESGELCIRISCRGSG